LFEHEKQTQLVGMFLEKHPYLNPNINNEGIMLTSETYIYNIMKYIQRDFKDEIQNYVLSSNQLKIFDI
jgi:short-subunit dehydrogenase involved in D-alanine esterification of teichoic acids